MNGPFEPDFSCVSHDVCGIMLVSLTVTFRMRSNRASTVKYWASVGTLPPGHHIKEREEEDMPFIDSKITLPVDAPKKEVLKSKLGKLITTLNKSETYNGFSLSVLEN